MLPKVYYSALVRYLKQPLSQEAAKYLVVGSGGYVIDVGIFNALSVARIEGLIELSPVWAKVISVIVAVIFTYIANSRWTFRKRTGRPEGLGRISRYAVVNTIGLILTIIPLYVSRYVLGFDSLLADNISANIFGVGLALVFRFIANRVWVFTASRPFTND